MIPVIIGTGPSLNECADDLRAAQKAGKVALFGCNYTYRDFDLAVHLACDPALHRHHGRFEIPGAELWHWDAAICNDHGYRHIEGVWVDGLWVEDTTKISLGHCSGWQLLNLAHHYITWGKLKPPILLVGHDMTYREGEPRHYFSGLSDEDGEYPQPLRKFSKFLKPDGSGLLPNYRHISEQVKRGEVCEIINCTPRSAMKWFPIKDFGAVMDSMRGNR